MSDVLQTLERICRPCPAPTLRRREQPCERCGAPYSPGFPFERWCPGACSRGGANRRLLVLSCSDRKNRRVNPAPAWDIYDGVLFRLCKALLNRGGWPGDVGVRILSAEHGLIRPDTPIATYDRRMTRDRARQLRGWASRIAEAVYEEEAGEVYLAMGATYTIAVDGLFPHHVRVIPGGGEIGTMQAALKGWLGDASPALPDLFEAVA